MEIKLPLIHYKVNESLFLCLKIVKGGLLFREKQDYSEFLLVKQYRTDLNGNNDTCWLANFSSAVWRVRAESILIYPFAQWLRALQITVPGCVNLKVLLGQWGWKGEKSLCVNLAQWPHLLLKDPQLLFPSTSTNLHRPKITFWREIIPGNFKNLINRHKTQPEKAGRKDTPVSSLYGHSSSGFLWDGNCCVMPWLCVLSGRKWWISERRHRNSEN